MGVGWEEAGEAKEPNVGSQEPIENRFAGLEGLEAREPKGLEVRRQGRPRNLT